MSDEKIYRYRVYREEGRPARRWRWEIAGVLVSYGSGWCWTEKSAHSAAARKIAELRHRDAVKAIEWTVAP